MRHPLNIILDVRSTVIRHCPECSIFAIQSLVELENSIKAAIACLPEGKELELWDETPSS